MTDDDLPVRIEMHPGSDTLLVLFGGIAGAIGMPPFEFYRAAKVLDCSKIFLRDSRQAWYQTGLPTIGGDIPAIHDFLQTRIAEAKTGRVRFVGNSMGGFAALLFCALLKAGRAIAFAPQTFLSPEKRALHKDERWAHAIARMHGCHSSTHIYDLQAHLRAHAPEMEASIYVCRSHPLDFVHASELADFPNIEIHPYEKGGHELVRALRDDGSLEDILRQ